MTREEQSHLLQLEHPKLINFLVGLGCSFQNAEDIVQNMHVKILESRYNVNDKGYFYQAAKHKFFDLDKNNKRDLKKELEKLPVTEKEIIYSDEYDGLNEAIRHLPEKSQVAIKMLYWQGKSRKEIAKKLKITEHGAKNVIQRAKESIKRYLLENNFR